MLLADFLRTMACLPHGLWRIHTSKTYKPNGARECARRRRQIAAGFLREENGLVRG